MIGNFGVLSVLVGGISLSHSLYVYTKYLSYNPSAVFCCAPYCRYSYEKSLSDPFLFLPVTGILLGITLLMTKGRDKKGASFGIGLALVSLLLQWDIFGDFLVKRMGECVMELFYQ